MAANEKQEQLASNEKYFIQSYRKLSSKYKTIFQLMLTALIFLDKDERENKEHANGNQ